MCIIISDSGTSNEESSTFPVRLIISPGIERGCCTTLLDRFDVVSNARTIPFYNFLPPPLLPTEAERRQTHSLKMLAGFLKTLTHFLKMLARFLKILTRFLKMLSRFLKVYYNSFYFNILENVV